MSIFLMNFYVLPMSYKPFQWQFGDDKDVGYQRWIHCSFFLD